MAVVPPDLAEGGVFTSPTLLFDESIRSRLFRSADLFLPAGFFVLMVLACFLWPVIHTIPSPSGGLVQYANLPPFSAGHLFGTDTVSNDVFSRILYGGRISIEVGIGANLIGIILGGYLGVLSAFKGGFLEAVIMRILDVLLAFPALVLALIVSEYLGPSELHVIWAISFFSIPAYARLARAQTLRLREQVYILAARQGGQRDRSILLRHIIPNVLPNLITFSLLGVAIAIIVEASLSFLGLGVPPPAPSWGNMIAAGQINMTSSPVLVIIPASFLFATVLSLNLLGDAVRARWASL
jgi:peptide/nickel transport system permease protein